MNALQQEFHEKRRMVDTVQGFLNHKLLLSFLIAACLPFTIWGAVKAWESNSNDVADWLPEDLPATQELMRFVQLFGSDELLMIRWDGCDLNDPRVELYRQALLQATDSPNGEVRYFRSLLTGPQMLDFYESAPLSMNRSDALKKMQGWIIAEDEMKTSLIAFVSKQGALDRHSAIDHVYAAANRIEGLSAEDLYLAGPTLNGVAIDRASQQNLMRLNLASFAVCLLVLFICQRNLRVAVLVFLTALFNEQLTMALIYYSGANMDSVLLLAANLTFVLSISVGIHLVNYYRDALKIAPIEVAPAWGCLLAAKPTALATLTTALGLASLQVSEIRPIARFGFYSSIMVIAAALLTMLFIGLHFTLWPLKKSSPEATTLEGLEPFAKMTALLRIARWPIVVLAFVGLIAGYFGALQLKSSVGLHELIADHSRVVKDYEHLESEIGPLTPIEVVVQTAPGNAKQVLRQFRAIADTHQAIEQLGDEYTVLSIKTFSPPAPPEKGGLVMIAKSSVFRRTLLANQERLKELGYLILSPEEHYWRITIRCPSSQSQGFGEIIAQVKATVAATLANQSEIDVREIIVGGGVPLVYQTQQQMLKDLIHSFFWAFGMVAMMLMLVFRSVLCGLICMIPNVLPCALAFGTMGFLGLPIELGTILTASAALGIAVDDSMHFLTWFRRAVEQGTPVHIAVQHSFRHCALAMIQTTFICGLGLVVFYFSDFLPISKFGVCMFVLLFLALAADLIILPALLLTPLGRPFLPRNQPHRIIR